MICQIVQAANTNPEAQANPLELYIPLHKTPTRLYSTKWRSHVRVSLIATEQFFP